MEKVELFTCAAGLGRLNNRVEFWAWSDGSANKGDIKILADNTDIEKEDEGLYIVKPKANVEMI